MFGHDDELVQILQLHGITRMTSIYCAGHAGVRCTEVTDHVSRSAIATGVISMDRTDVLKSVTEDLVQEEEMVRVDNIYLEDEKTEV